MKPSAFILLLVAGALSACHEPYSNEDLRFLAEGVPPDIAIEVPVEDGVTGVDDPVPPPANATAQFYLDTVAAAEAINRDILSLVAWVDAIVATPPSARDEDRRTWGPLVGANGVSYTLVTDRVQTSTVVQATSTSTPTESSEIFEFTMLATSPAQPEPRLLFFGQQVADREALGHQGRMFIDLDGARAVDPNQTGQGQVVVLYDDRFQALTLELLLGPLYTAEPSAAWRHTQSSSGDGAFLFFLRENVDPTSAAQELWVVAARWLADGRGRADVLISEGDLALPLFASECWDAGFDRTYLLSNIPDSQYLPEGSLVDCAPDLRAADLPE